MPVSPSADYNIILLHFPASFGVIELRQVASIIRQKNSRINVFISRDTPLPETIRRVTNRLPTLVFSPFQVVYCRPEGSTIFCGRPIAKDEQVELFSRHGINAPKSRVLTAESRFDEAEWGQYVIVKPTYEGSWGGKGVSLVRTASLRFKPQSSFPENHHGSRGPLLVQEFIDTGFHSVDYRVVTFFGRPLYALRRKQLTPFPNLSADQPDEVTEGVTTNSTSGKRRVVLCYEEDILQFASRMYRIAPDVPLQGCDIRREASSKKLFALEINPIGTTWKAVRAQSIPTISGLRREEQFGAFEIMADALIEEVTKIQRTGARLDGRIGQGVATGDGVAAPAERTSTAAAAKKARKSLVLVHHPGWQDIQDFEEIKARVEKKASDIDVFLLSNLAGDELIERQAARNPTLVVCPSWLGSANPLRGKVHLGARIPKNEQLERLAQLAIPVPRWALAEPDLNPDPDEWGPLLVIKPAHSFSGQGSSISIVPTRDYRFREAYEYPEHHAGRNAPMLVQAFKSTGNSARHYRVNTLYGRALYCMLNIRTKPLPDLDNLDTELFSDAIATNVREQAGRELRLVNDADVLALASRCHDAFPEVPLKGVDIIREEPTGKLFVLELNCTSNTWHISSNYFRSNRTGSVTKQEMVLQFGAWDVAADVLIDQTRQHAV